jgi:hypothetical protein
VVTVTRIDRLARSTFNLFAIVKQIVDAKAQFRSLAEPWAETGTSTGRLMLAVLGGLADVERDLIHTRTAEGRGRAQKRGQRMGRKPKLTAEQQDEARKRRRKVPRSPDWRAATAWGRVRFHGSPRFCDRASQATARLPKYSGACLRPRNRGIDCPAPCVTLASAASI